MSEPIYLYRAILSKPLAIGTADHAGELPAGFSIGRRSGYLSRSSAAEHAYRHAEHFGSETEVIRSEPIVFLTEREKEAKRADELEAEAKRIRERISVRAGHVDVVASDANLEAIKAALVGRGINALRSI